MARYSCLGVVIIAVMAAVAPASAGQGAEQNPAMSAAAKASPELVTALSKELGSSPEQAAGAAGALFGLAKSRLQPDQFAQVAKAVPGMDMLLKAAPAIGGIAGGGRASALTGLASLSSAFSGLGLKPDLVGKAIPVLTSFVTKSGGAGAGNLLASVLK